MYPTFCLFICLSIPCLFYGLNQPKCDKVGQLTSQFKFKSKSKINKTKIEYRQNILIF